MLPPKNPADCARPVDAVADAQTIEQAVTDFVDKTFSLRGSLGLHRHAIGWDLLRAPANVVLSPLFLLQRVLGWGLLKLRLRRASHWLLARPVLLQTALNAELDRRLARDLLEPLGLTPDANALETYAGTRAATGEFTVTLGVTGAGAAAFHAITPGVTSLAPAVAAVIANATAIATFPLGGALGGLWYTWFPPKPDLQLILTSFFLLAALLALLSTFIGLLTDPLQRKLGWHQARLRRLLNALAREKDKGFAAPELLLARSGDLADMGLTLLRFLRGG
ncbi:hypothetical protein AQS8620_01785 [Aquimixticola soesokkakensis]|uniref:Uncharacterized protein n=1 Tax=Aquimixticola soesokkakensis TaxID=1519096 RepID=A0A1Y5SQL7_9RHOB|nr:DUF6635 family protein [Aquimixticola soesokkakensis]SLN44390.1 hypothetical protein AQS8620_01785 [Aquimixticola soesokkakensis]